MRRRAADVVSSCPLRIVPPVTIQDGARHLIFSHGKWNQTRTVTVNVHARPFVSCHSPLADILAYRLRVAASLENSLTARDTPSLTGEDLLQLSLGLSRRQLQFPPSAIHCVAVALSPVVLLVCIFFFSKYQDELHRCDVIGCSKTGTFFFLCSKLIFH